MKNKHLNKWVFIFFDMGSEEIKNCKHLVHFMENGADYVGEFSNQKSLANIESRNFELRAVVLN